MNYGIQISASGALTALYRQDVFANNLANLDTTGFKADVPTVRHRLTARGEDGLNHLPSNELLEKLGGGVHLHRTRVSFEQGSLEQTSDPLDLAIRGDGFFVVREEGSGNTDRLRLTRDGRFTLNARGELVMASTGLPVMDEQNRPITLDRRAGEVVVRSDGAILQNGNAIATLKVVDVPDRSQLAKLGDSLFRASARAITSATGSKGQVVQYMKESSSVDELRALMGVQSAGRDVDSNMGMIQYQDRMLERAISQFGRIS
jgi:flagellar basal-body rod protein FlgF